VIIPSLSLDQDVMARVTGAHHYEERMLCMLMASEDAADAGHLCHQSAGVRGNHRLLSPLASWDSGDARAPALDAFFLFRFDAQTTGGQDPGATAIARSAPRCDSGDRDGAYVVLQRIGA
jgi:hypothetical protein